MNHVALRPLQVLDAAEMAEVLSDPSLYDFTGRAAQRGGPKTPVCVPGPWWARRWFGVVVQLDRHRRSRGFRSRLRAGDGSDVGWARRDRVGDRETVAG